MTTEKQITPWSDARKTRGQEVHRLISGDLPDVLFRAYSVVDPTMTELPKTVLDGERTKFRQIATGDFSDTYYRDQSALARNIAQQVSFVKYLEAYGLYAGGLVKALSAATRGKRESVRADLFQSLLDSIFADVAVAMHHFFATEADTDARAMEVLGTAMTALASGDLSHRIGDEAPEKIARASEHYNEAAELLRWALHEIEATLGEVRSGTRSIASSVEDLSRRTENQAASLEETAASLSEITETVKGTSEGAREATAAASDASRMVTRSGEVMETAEKAMGEISTSSEEMASILTVIDEIAVQTNLLALNATVEAARAGDAGKGFAVVASEVRALAHRSAAEAKSIRSLITSTSEHIRNGEKVIAEVSTVLGQATQKVAEIDHLLREIAASAQEEASGVDQINVAVGDMDRMTQQNAAMVEETLGAAVTLRENTDRLGVLVGRFQLGGATTLPRAS